MIVGIVIGFLLGVVAVAGAAVFLGARFDGWVTGLRAKFGR